MDILDSQRSAKKFNEFWKGTRKQNSKHSMPANVDGSSDPKLTANIFRGAFRSSSNLPSNPSPESCIVKDPIRFFARNVAGIVQHMKRSKSPRHDGLSIEHLQHAGRIFIEYFLCCTFFVYVTTL